MNILKAENLSPASRGPLEKHASVLTSPAVTATIVLQARLKICKDETKCLFSWALNDQHDSQERSTLDIALKSAICELQGEVKVGAAPPSPQERQIKKDIVVLRRELGLSK